MTAPDDFAPADNPFSARHVRPGALGFRFPAGQSATSLVDKLQQAGWRGQIVGPHGTGKSTLLASLLPVIRAVGRSVVHVELHDGQRTLPVAIAPARLTRPAIVVVDGYEQLSLPSRLHLSWHCRCGGLGLLITTHRRVRLPLLLETRMDADLAYQLVRDLLDNKADLVGPEEIARRLDQHDGNLREVLFDLYDVYEQGRLTRRNRIPLPHATERKGPPCK